ncbi:hypothetical protein L7F22_018702 [Adiantum nelumboides]|nr:hypothetical protein [Adiantum nelumboides]
MISSCHRKSIHNARVRRDRSRWLGSVMEHDAFNCSGGVATTLIDTQESCVKGRAARFLCGSSCFSSGLLSAFALFLVSIESHRKSCPAAGCDAIVEPGDTKSVILQIYHVQIFWLSFLNSSMPRQCAEHRSSRRERRRRHSDNPRGYGRDQGRARMSAQAESRQQSRMLFVKNLNYTVSDQAGRWPKTKGTAFVVYEEVSDAKSALEHLNGFHLQERYIVVEAGCIDLVAALELLRALVNGVPLGLLPVEIVEALGLSELVDLGTDESSEDLLGQRVVGGLALSTLVVLVLSPGSYQLIGPCVSEIC